MLAKDVKSGASRSRVPEELFTLLSFSASNPNDEKYALTSLVEKPVISLNFVVDKPYCLATLKMVVGSLACEKIKSLAC